MLARLKGGRLCNSTDVAFVKAIHGITGVKEAIACTEQAGTYFKVLCSCQRSNDQRGGQTLRNHSDANQDHMVCWTATHSNMSGGQWPERRDIQTQPAFLTCIGLLA